MTFMIMNFASDDIYLDLATDMRLNPAADSRQPTADIIYCLIFQLMKYSSI